MSSFFLCSLFPFFSPSLFLYFSTSIFFTNNQKDFTLSTLKYYDINISSNTFSAFYINGHGDYPEMFIQQYLSPYMLFCYVTLALSHQEAIFFTCLNLTCIITALNEQLMWTCSTVSWQSF